MTVPTPDSLAAMADEIDRSAGWWRFPSEPMVSGFLGPGPVIFVGDQPSTNPWSSSDPGRRLFYDSLQSLGLGGSHLTDLVKRRGPSGELGDGLPSDFAVHRQFFERELRVVRPQLIVAIGKLARRHLPAFMGEHRVPVLTVWHFAYGVRQQMTVPEYTEHLALRLGVVPTNGRFSDDADSHAQNWTPNNDMPLSGGKEFEMTRELVKRVTEPGGRRPYRWTLRRDDNGHHHRVLHLSKSPYLMDLRWRETKQSEVHEVGYFLLDLHALLDAGVIRGEPTGSSGPDVRVRVVMTAAGSFRIQVRAGAPSVRLPV